MIVTGLLSPDTMKIAVLSASPKQQLSLTLQTVRALSKMCPEDQFDICFIKDVNDHSEFESKANESDLIIILSSLYHFNVHGQLMAFLKGIKIAEGKPVTYISTSGGNMDVPAHNYMRSFARHNKLKWIRSLSLLDEDILKECRREELYRWFLYVKDIALDKKPEAESLKDISVTILDAGDDEKETKESALTLKEKYEALGANVKIHVLRDLNIKGCIACFGCYTNNKCVIKDDFEALTDEIYADTDILVVVSGVNYNQFSTRYKYFLDRHVKYGRFCQEHEIIRAYMVCGEIDGMDMAELEQHTYVVDSLDQDCHVGIYTSDSAGMDQIVRNSAYVCIHELFPQRNTYTYGLSMQFANLAFRLQNMTPRDYEYFKSKGYYETPEIIPNVAPISGLEDGRMSCKMRLIAFEEMLSKLDGPPALTKRGTRAAMYKLAEPSDKSKKTKGGFFRKK